MAKLELSNAGLENRQAWLDKGFKLPEYDRVAMQERTKKEPTWLHFGAGNIFKAFQANVAQNLLNQGILDKGIIAVERTKRGGGNKTDSLTVLVTLKSDGQVEKTVVGSIAENCYLYGDEARLGEIFEAPTLQMVSFTITEKAYSLVDGKGELLADVAEDTAKGPEGTVSYMGKLTALLYKRYLAGAAPVAMVSMDNCSHNGDKLYAAISHFAKAWTEKGLVDAGFAAYVDSDKVSFPWSMIDKITPSPDMSVGTMLEADGLEGFTPVVTPRGTHTAPFVNAEESEYLVIEDNFPNGKVALDKGGIFYTERETVDKVERMKVCTCLNPLHTALAVYGCLLGYDRIFEEMKDPQLSKLVNIIGYKEGLPVVTDPGIIKPAEFIDTVLNVRLPNPFMPDSPWRIATDTSQKLPIRFGETIKAYMADDKLNVADLKLIPLVHAGWLRYLMGIGDDGKAYEPSPDPMLDTVRPYIAGYGLGKVPGEAQLLQELKPLLQNTAIFGVDLVEAGLAETVVKYFAELCAGVGAVRATLKKYVGE